jgi:hypothetical protein
MLRKRFLWILWQRYHASLYTSARIVVGCMFGGLLLFMLGPLPFIPLWKRKDQRSWHYKWYGWKPVAEGARWPLLLYTAILYLHQPIYWLWSSLFALLARWVHIPALVWFGNETLWPLTAENLLFRWVLAWPLALLVSHTLAQQRRPGIKRVRRVLTPQDQQPGPLQGQNKNAKHHSNRKSQTQRPRKANTGSKIVNTSSTTSTEPVIPDPTSFWGRTDWSQVPDDDPLKQKVMADAQLRLTAPSEGHSVQNKLAGLNIHHATTPGAPHSITHAQPSNEDDTWDMDQSVIKL